jgi:PTS system ascorbate-specific IIB component
MKILAVCGSGLGSSFMLSLSIQDVLKEMGVEGVEVSHADFSSLSHEKADYIVCGRDIAMALEEGRKDVISLDSILSKAEIKEKLKKIFPDA